MSQQYQKKISLELQDQNIDFDPMKGIDEKISIQKPLISTNSDIDIQDDEHNNKQEGYFEMSEEQQVVSESSIGHQSTGTKKACRRSSKTSTNYLIINQSILQDFQPKERNQFLSKMQKQYSINRKNYTMIILLLFRFFPKQKQTLESYKKLKKVIEENLNHYQKTSKRTPDQYHNLRIEISRLEIAIQLFFLGKIDQAIDACYQATDKEGNNIGNSANYRKKCHQIILNYLKNQ